jgi:hypothetical protein
MVAEWQIAVNLTMVYTDVESSVICLLYNHALVADGAPRKKTPASNSDERFWLKGVMHL